MKEKKRKNLLLDGQTRKAKLCSQLVNFPSVRPLIKLLNLFTINTEQMAIQCLIFCHV